MCVQMIADEFRQPLLKRLCWFIISLGTVGLASSVFSTIEPNASSALIYLASLVLLAVILLVTLIIYITDWKLAIHGWLVPSVLCCTFLLCFWAVYSGPRNSDQAIS